jgi:hypothetical protein
MFSKLFALFLSIYYMITPYVAPSTADPIKVLDEQSVEEYIAQRLPKAE